MMQCMEDYAFSNGFQKLKLNAQSYAIPFYEKRNYTITSPEFLEAGIPHRAMEKRFIIGIKRWSLDVKYARIITVINFIVSL